jgi:hypothetical protein
MPILPNNANSVEFYRIWPNFASFKLHAFPKSSNDGFLRDFRSFSRGAQSCISVSPCARQSPPRCREPARGGGPLPLGAPRGIYSGGHNEASAKDKTSATTEAARNGVMILEHDKTSGTTEAGRNGVMILRKRDLGCGWGCERVNPEEYMPAIKMRRLRTLVWKSIAPTSSSGLYSTLLVGKYCTGQQARRERSRCL